MSCGHTSLAGVKVDKWYDGYESHDRIVPPCPICRARNPISHRTKKGQFSIHFCSIICIKYFLICKIKRYVIMFSVYKNRFLARQIGNGRSGMVMAFIPDNISAHVHLLEDNDPIKKTKMAAVSWGFPSSTKTTRVFQWRSWQVYLCRFCRQRKVNLYNFQLFQVVVLILEAAITFFCSSCNDNSVHAMAH